MAKMNDAMMIKMDEKVMTATVSKQFAKNAMIYGTEEYRLWKAFSAENPGFEMVTREIAKKVNKMSYKGLTLQNMRTWMILHGTDAQVAVMDRYITAGIKLKTVRDWFLDEKIAGFGNKTYFDYKDSFDAWFANADAHIKSFDLQFMRKFVAAEATKEEQGQLEKMIRSYRLEKTVTLRDIQNWFFTEFAFFSEEEYLHLYMATEKTAEAANVTKLPEKASA